MRSSRTVGVALVTAAAAVATTATPAAAEEYEGPRPMASAVQWVEAGKATWVKAYWKTRRDICGAKVSVAARDVRVQYPENTESYTSFRRNATLAEGRADYTAFKVTAKAASSRTVRLAVTVVYTLLPKGTFAAGADPDDVDCKGKEQARLSWIRMPVVVDEDQ